MLYWLFWWHLIKLFMQLYGNNEGLGTISATYVLNLNFRKYFGFELCVHVWCIILDCLPWIGVWIWVCCCCLCVWNGTKVCMSHSSEPGSPRRDMQGLVPLFCLRLSLRRRIFGLGERSSRLGEWVSPKRELERVGCFGLGIPLRRGSHFLAKECLAKVIVSRLSEKSKNVLMLA